MARSSTTFKKGNPGGPGGVKLPDEIKAWREAMRGKAIAYLQERQDEFLAIMWVLMKEGHGEAIKIWANLGLPKEPDELNVNVYNALARLSTEELENRARALLAENNQKSDG